MQLNQATDYAFRAVLHLALAGTGQVVEAQSIAREQSIPMRFLLKIMRSLVRGGIVRSYRGVGGGFALARPAQEITLLDVVQAMEGPIRVNRCLVDPRYCSRHWSQHCPVHQALGQVQSALAQALASHTFADLALGVRAGPTRG
ncbi:MAG: Rrf2 family transcriptional regulator [Firmicutes bacterium]|nr:Rrf2 family transcriptional regulator [Bacillota bacterium]